jgi:hypothetical protein
LLDRRQRARVYELVLREGRPSDVVTYLDGALLIDLWNELVLPAAVRAAWNGVVTGQDKEQAGNGRGGTHDLPGRSRTYASSG